MKFSIIFFYTVIAILLLLILQVIFEHYLQKDYNAVFDVKSFINRPTNTEYTEPFKDVNDPVIVWWTNFIDFSATRKCGDVSCFFTNNREFRHHHLAKVLIFYGSNINITDLPLPREGDKILWALLHEESPRNIPTLAHVEVLSLFNYTSTFSRYSDFPLTTQYLKDLQVLTSKKFFVPTEKKKKMKKELGLAPVVYIQSDCSTPLDRDSYVVELSKYIAVDSYGSCLHNKDLPPSLLNNLDTMMSDELLDFVARYEFAIAIENGECDDYITEKLWRPLIAGTVPIYFGSPSVKDWLPNNNSAILIRDFTSPKHLAEYLHDLMNNQDKYNMHLQHKLQPEKGLSSKRLIDTLNSRKWGIDNDYEQGNFIDHFECFVCRKIHENKDEYHFASDKHYQCQLPRSCVTGQRNSSNDWSEQWRMGKCEAKVLRYFADVNQVNYSDKGFKSKVLNYFMKGLC